MTPQCCVTRGTHTPLMRWRLFPDLRRACAKAVRSESGENYGSWKCPRFVDVRHFVLCHMKYCTEQCGKQASSAPRADGGEGPAPKRRAARQRASKVCRVGAAQSGGCTHARCIFIHKPCRFACARKRAGVHEERRRRERARLLLGVAGLSEPAGSGDGERTVPSPFRTPPGPRQAQGLGLRGGHAEPRQDLGGRLRSRAGARPPANRPRAPGALPRRHYP